MKKPEKFLSSTTPGRNTPRWWMLRLRHIRSKKGGEVPPLTWRDTTITEEEAQVNLNLCNDSWLRFELASGETETLPLKALGRDDLRDIVLPRQDFYGAGWQFQIGRASCRERGESCAVGCGLKGAG